MTGSFGGGVLQKISHIDWKEWQIKAGLIAESNWTYWEKNKTVFSIIALTFMEHYFFKRRAFLWTQPILSWLSILYNFSSCLKSLISLINQIISWIVFLIFVCHFSRVNQEHLKKIWDLMKKMTQKMVRYFLKISLLDRLSFENNQDFKRVDSSVLAKCLIFLSNYSIQSNSIESRLKFL